MPANNTRVRKQAPEERLTALVADVLTVDHQGTKIIENSAREISLIAEAIHEDMETFKDVVEDAKHVVVAMQKNKREFGQMLHAVQRAKDSEVFADYSSGYFERGTSFSS